MLRQLEKDIEKFVAAEVNKHEYPCFENDFTFKARVIVKVSEKLTSDLINTLDEYVKETIDELPRKE